MKAESTSDVSLKPSQDSEMGVRLTLTEELDLSSISLSSSPKEAVQIQSGSTRLGRNIFWI